MRSVTSYIWMLASVLVLVSCILISNYSPSFIRDDIDLEQIQADIQKIIDYSDVAFNRLLTTDNPWQVSNSEHCDYVLYEHGKLIYWTSNKIDFEKLSEVKIGGVHRLASRIYYVFSKQVGTKKVYGLIPLIKDFSLENKFLKNKKFSAVYIPDNYSLVNYKTEMFISVHYLDRTDLLYFKKLSQSRLKMSWAIAVVIIYFIAFIILSLMLVVILERIFCKRIFIRILLLTSYFVFAYLFLINEYFIPFVDQFVLFKPFDFANTWIYSLGMLLLKIVSILIYASVLVNWLSRCKPINKKVVACLAQIFVFLSFLLSFWFVEDIIYNSTAVFVGFDSISLRYQDVLLLLSFGMLLLINLNLLSLIINKSNQSFSILDRKVLTFFYVPVFSFLLFLNWQLIYPIVLFVVSNVLFTLQYQGKIREGANHFLLLLLSSTILVLHVAHFSEEKEQNVRLLHLSNYETENNRLSEYLIGELDGKIKLDTVLQRMLYDLPDSDVLIYDYFKKQYLSGYWSQFQSEIVLCGSEDIFLPPNDLQSCEQFFGSKINGSSKQIERTRFLSIHNYGLEYFLGQYQYVIEPDSSLVDLYVYFEPKHQFQNLGYPNILLTQQVGNVIENVKNDYGYSFAKYVDGNLLSQKGTCVYKTKYFFPNFEKGRKKISQEGYVHLIEKSDEDAYNIISWKEPTLWTFFIALSYVFILFSIVFYAGKYLAIFIGVTHFEVTTLKDKLRLSFIGILMVTFIVLAYVIIYQTAQISQDKQNQILQEKMHSIVVELEHKLEKNGEKIETISVDELSYYLAKFSNVFFTDINFFDLEGRLIASSRPEVFEKGLVGRVINPIAFNEVGIKKHLSYSHTEEIGTQKYLSAYIPFRDKTNKTVAYLNLPYFAKNDQIQKDLSDLIMSLLNLFVLLFLLISIFTVFISNRITRPLSVIQEKLKSFRVEHKNEEIVYHANDEIGDLVDEYNRTVRELNASISLLAQKEREGAWKEMAKQIAHEIKNPLTPMKLSLQHLKYVWMQDVEGKEEKTGRTVDLVVQQIDRLAETASAFADFSKMTVANPSNFDVLALIKEQVELYILEADITIITEENTCLVYADEQQISRVFQNILSNAVQASKENEGLRVHINITEDNKLVTILVSDNGRGMDEETQKHLFVPYFTTKSSGTGLGLAIVKQIVENNNGEISFKSEKGEGTCFSVSLPKSLKL